MHAGLLIAFEGIDGTGKSSQICLLAGHLRSLGCPVTETREPTDGPYGARIRELFTSRHSCSLEEELDLFVNDRRQHVEEVINPALTQGRIVLTDRYYFSTAAYQGAAGVSPAAIFERNRFAPVPDLVLLLTLTPEEAIARIREQRKEQLNDFEQLEQLRRVSALFAGFNQPCITRIGAGPSLEVVQTEIRRVVMALLTQRNFPCIA